MKSLLTVGFVLVCAAGAVAQGAHYFYFLPDGWVAPFGRNEVAIVSTIADPPALRMGALTGRGLGKLSFNHVRPDGAHDQVAFIQGILDDRYPDEQLVGGFRFNIHGPDTEESLNRLNILHDGICLGDDGACLSWADLERLFALVACEPSGLAGNVC